MHQIVAVGLDGFVRSRTCVPLRCRSESRPRLDQARAVEANRGFPLRENFVIGRLLISESGLGSREQRRNEGMHAHCRTHCRRHQPMQVAAHAFTICR